MKQSIKETLQVPEANYDIGKFGAQIPVAVIHAHANMNVGGKTYGSTIFSDKIKGAKIVLFPETNFFGICEVRNGKEHWFVGSTAGIQTFDLFPYQAK